MCRKPQSPPLAGRASPCPKNRLAAVTAQSGQVVGENRAAEGLIGNVSVLSHGGVLAVVAGALGGHEFMNF